MYCALIDSMAQSRSSSKIRSSLLYSIAWLYRYLNISIYNLLSAPNLTKIIHKRIISVTILKLAPNKLWQLPFQKFQTTKN